MYRRRNGRNTGGPHKEIPNHILLGMVRDMIREGHTATIPVKGYSMRPFLEHLRDRVVLDAPHVLEVGDAVLAEIAPGHYVLHRIIRIEGDRLTLMGDGNVKGTERCRRQDVAGVVTHYLRPTRTLSASDAGLKRCIRLWRSLLPVRRYLLFAYRAMV
ncbi:MAG: S24/S26 family peptidase [Bacteroidaceae bacterium]|nr:S24/S26 family peptidase [Bacteroidaceae bacterium]MDE7166117.1 S24/S26 family peptidase [Bacteroidaceae bacterium]